MKIKMIIVSVLVTLSFSGCGVDKDRLVELTGGKNYSQIKKDFAITLANKNNADNEIYRYWLEKNGEKVDSTFDIELYEIEVVTGYKEQLKQINTSMKQLKVLVDNEVKRLKKKKYRKLNYNLIRQIDSEYTTASYLSNLDYVKNIYLPFLKKMKNDLMKAKE